MAIATKYEYGICDIWVYLSGVANDSNLMGSEVLHSGDINGRFGKFCWLHLPRSKDSVLRPRIHLEWSQVKVKVKKVEFTLQQAMKAQRGSRL